MATTLLILSIIFFISTYGIHLIINNKNEIEKPMYLSTPLFLIPVACGFILPVIPLYYLIEYNWIVLAVSNLIFVIVTNQLFARAYLVRLSTGILGKDMVYTLGLGTIALVLGIILKK